MFKYLERYIWDNPILTGEFKRRVRTNKLFITQTFFLGFLVTIIYLNWMDTYSYSYYRDPSYMGRQVFRMILFIQFGAISLLCPSFTCTNISSEIEKKTFDLLLTSLLDSREIISGKLNSTIIYIAMFLVSSIPVSCVVFFFGGISPLDLFFSYIFIFLGAIFISMMGLFISARTGKTNISIGISYIVTFVLFIFGSIIISEFFDRSGNNFTSLVDLYVISIPTWLLFVLEIISLITILFISTSSLIEVIYPNKNVKVARAGFMIFYIINGLFIALKVCSTRQSANDLLTFYHMILFFSILFLPFFIHYDKISVKKGIFRWIFYPDHRFSCYFIPFITFITAILSGLLLSYAFHDVKDRLFILTSSAIIMIFIYCLAVISKYISGFFDKGDPFIIIAMSLYWVPVIISYFIRNASYHNSGEISIILRLIDPFLILKGNFNGTVNVMPEISAVLYLVIAVIFNILIYVRQRKVKSEK
jgi:hypothetical protein